MKLASRLRRLLLLAALACLAIGLAPSASLAKYASYVIDADTGRVLHNVNGTTRNYPASLTKMMTLYLAFEALSSGRWSLDRRLKVSRRAARQPASRLGLKAGETITVRDAILAIVTKSANDAATVIAESLAPSERRFAMVMTARAHALGMRRTTFRNASGLPHRGQMSTAQDMAVLARRLLKDFPQYYHFFSTKAFTFRGVRHANHNGLLKTYNGVDGIKTGYIRASGFNLVASAKRNGRRLIGVVFGGRSPKARNRLMARLLDKGFRLVTREARAAGAKATAPKAGAKATASATRRTTSVKVAAAARPAKPAPKARGRWAIQVGAYNRYRPAYNMAAKVARQWPTLLAGGKVRVAPLKLRRRRPVYRSRILGLSRKQAYRACRVLKAKKIDCMELRTRKLRRLASISYRPSRP